MRIVFPIIFATIIVALFGFIEILLIRTLNKVWWHYKPVKWAAILLPVFGIVSILMWLVGFLIQVPIIYGFGATATALTLVMLLALMLSLPFSGILNQIHRWIEKRKGVRPKNGIDEKRRIFLKGTAAALPIITLSLGTGGIAGSFGRTKVYIRQMAFENLPSQLEGLKILHLTDSHLGMYKYPVHIEEILVDAQKFEPDLVLLTGDIADELSLLPEILKLISESNPRYGVYAVLGNHEYYRGIREVRWIYDRSPVPLLVGSGVAIDINGASLYIAGADDPKTMRGDISKFLRNTIEKSIAGAPSDSFRVLMSHRPEAFDHVGDLGIPLTLSGHTHGGQIGVGGRSFFESLMPGRYLWGEYRNSLAQMYLSAGIGHWFPFRLGCPPEAPIIKIISNQSLNKKIISSV